LSGLLDDLFEMGLRVGRGALDLLSGSQVSEARELLGKAGSALSGFAPSLGSCRCGCEVPPPCWMPRELPPVDSRACPGATTKLDLVVENCAAEAHSVSITVSGPDAGLVTVTPAILTIAPFEHGLFTATMSVPPGADHHWRAGVILWVHGCREHVLHWEVRTDERGCGTHHEVRVDDCPDYVHHWYDHFYCERPCGAAAKHV
jgi:hypothetical protein